ncbi:MAG TPA: sugar ABC transporter permease [Devosia sp.]|nr:sugar ABC transporter permease [Devosia sp.]
MTLGKRNLLGLAYMAPALLFVAVFVLYPFGQLIATSLTDASLLGGGKWVGLANYTRMFTGDPSFWKALWFTVKYTVIITPILMILGYALALLTAQNDRILQLARGIIFMPVVIGLGTSSLLWFWLFDQQVGLFDKALMDLHIADRMIVWFTNPDWALWGVIISVVWKVVGFGMILFVAAIQSISREVTEASMIDGASYWQRVRMIYLPLTARTVLLVTLISAIGSMLAFEQLYIMTGGGPRGLTFTSVYWIYQSSFIKFQLGYGAALSVVLTAIIMVAAAIQITLTARSAPQ